MRFEDIDRLRDWASANEEQITKSQNQPEKLAFIRDKLIESIVANPVYKQYFAHINYGEKLAINDKPWHAIGERLSAALICLAASKSTEIEILGLSPGAPRELLMLSGAMWILRSTPYLWCSDMERLADASPLPPHIVSPTIIPNPLMFWSRDVAYRSELGSNNWIALMHQGDKCCVIADLDNEKEHTLKVAVSSFPYGKRWPEDFKTEGEDFARLLKRCAFLNSVYIGKSKHQLPRHQRHQLARMGQSREEIEETIHVVTLRREVKIPHPVVPGQERQEIEWKHQWWVSAHYRAQWYPSEKAHHVKWIAPYLKGPSDKPILEKVYAVVQ
jgi:hypothetical protein